MAYHGLTGLSHLKHNAIQEVIELFHLGISTLCTFVQDMHTAKIEVRCAIDRFDRTDKASEINQEIYLLLDGKYVMVLDCAELIDEEPLLTQDAYHKYVAECRSYNLITAVETYQAKIDQSFRIQGVSDDTVIDDPVRLFFVIELMLTDDIPSYTTGITMDDVHHLYSQVSRSRTYMIHTINKANLTVNYASSGKVATIHPLGVRGSESSGKYIDPVQANADWPAKPFNPTNIWNPVPSSGGSP